MPLNDDLDWRRVYSGLHFDADVYPKDKVGISPFYTPETFTGETLVRIWVGSTKAKPHWWLAGTLTQIIEDPVLNPDGPDFEAERWRIPLNRTTLIKLSDWGETRLKFEVPYWLPEIEIFIEQYIGNE